MLIICSMAIATLGRTSWNRLSWLHGINPAFLPYLPFTYSLHRSKTVSNRVKGESLCRTISSFLSTPEPKSSVPTPGLILFQDSCKTWFHSRRSPVPSPPQGVRLRLCMRGGGSQSSSLSQRIWKLSLSLPLHPNSLSLVPHRCWRSHKQPSCPDNTAMVIV